MTEDELKDTIRARWKELDIPKDKCGKGVLCIHCTSGSGPNGTGPTVIRESPGRFYCHACRTSFDALAAVQHWRGFSSFLETLNWCADRLGLAADDRRGERSKSAGAPHPEDPKDERRRELADLQQLIRRAQEAFTPDCDGARYLAGRGISFETAQRMGVGFCAAYRNIFASSSVPASPRIVFPLSGWASFTTRDIRPNVKGNAKGYVKQKEHARGASCGIFNIDALTSRSGNPCFIVEGETDALSIAEAGGSALALGSVSNKDHVIDAIHAEQNRARPHINRIVLCLDNDDAGRKAADALADALTASNLPFLRADISAEYKDPNEALQRDAAGFRARVKKAIREVADVIPPARPKDIDAASRWNVRQQWGEFTAAVQSGFARPISTGLENLDAALDGGIRPGLITLGGSTGGGKTAIALQIADYIAMHGRPVLIIALEMSRNELTARSISRLTHELSFLSDAKAAKTVNGVLNGDLYKAYSKDELRILDQAIKQHGSTAVNLYVRESIGAITAEEIRASTETILRVRGVAPVVIVDYLQIIKPENDRMTEKQAADRAVLSFKQLARDLETPVIQISSLNRMNYKAGTDIGLDAIKESGGIEYGSDVVCLLVADGEYSEDKHVPRKMKLKILKNRHGKPTGKNDMLEFDYYAAFNRFLPVLGAKKTTGGKVF